MCLAIPGKVEELQGEGMSRSAKVSFGGAVRSVNLGLVEDVAVGDYVLVHVGVALSKINEEEAQQTFEYLKQIDELDEIGPPKG
jgi:hydrogenase expression/formation protein HypC